MMRFIGVCLLLWLPVAAAAETWYVGILAPQGAEAARRQWQPRLDELQRRRPQAQFVAVPLALDQWRQALSDGRVDFALGPQAQFVVLPDTQGWRWLATAALPEGRTPRAVEQTGSTIWVRQSSPVRHAADLRGRKIVAVDPQAFGGFVLAEHALWQQGLHQGRDYRVSFTGYPVEQTIEALDRGEADAAVTPLCLMEEWQAARPLAAANFRPLTVHTTVQGCVAGTPVYPHWLLAALPTVPEETATEMMTILFATPGWSPPVSFAGVEQVLADLGRHPHHVGWQEQVRRWLAANRLLAGVLVLAVLISLINYAWMSWLAYRRRQKLAQAYRQLRERDRLLAHADRLNIAGEMAAGLAHELNQPLAAIRHYAEGGLQLLQQGADPASQQRALDRIIEATERGSHIIRNLRQWVKKPDYVEGAVDIEALLRGCADWLACQKPVPKLVWHNRSGATHLVTVAGLVEQVLMNCLLNSQQQGARQISVTVDKSAADGTWRLWVEDDGGGFDAAMLAQPLRPFRSSKEEGLGLGLVICDRLLRSMGGSLHLGNRDDGVRGARIELRLPERKMND